MRGSTGSNKSFDNGNTFDSHTGNGVYPHSTATQDGGIVMDEVNFKYLKHVIVKFLTSREVSKFLCYIFLTESLISQI